MTPPPGAAARRAALLAFLRARYGLSFGAGRDEGVWPAAVRAAAGAGASSPEAYVDAVLDGREPPDALLDEVTTGETYFFRDLEGWRFVEREVLPAARARRAGGPLRCWSAGCASGEEPYTLAVLLQQAGLLADALVLATDVSPAALARARRAEYSLWSLRGGADARLRRHLAGEGPRFRLDASVAGRVRFFQLNLADPGWPSPATGIWDLDLVLCRNVLIYLAPEVVAEVARRLHAALAPGGVLLTAPSDPPLARHAPFERRTGEHGVAYARPERAPPLPIAGRRDAPRRPAAARQASPAHPVPPRPPRTRATAAPPAAAAAPSPRPSHPVCGACRSLLDAGRVPEALAAVDAALASAPLDPELHVMRALALTDLGRPGAAEDAVRRALYLDRRAPFPHHLLGMLRREAGDAAGATAAFRRAAALCDEHPGGEPVPLSGGLDAGTLAAAARLQLEGLGEARPAPGQAGRRGEPP